MLSGKRSAQAVVANIDRSSICHFSSHDAILQSGGNLGPQPHPQPSLFPSDTPTDCLARRSATSATATPLMPMGMPLPTDYPAFWASDSPTSAPMSSYGASSKLSSPSAIGTSFPAIYHENTASMYPMREGGISATGEHILFQNGNFYADEGPMRKRARF